MKKYTMLILICATVLFFSSCAVKEYTDTLSCKSVAESLASEISDPEDYRFYTDEDIKYMFEDTSLFEECSFIYSTSSDDIDEICVIKAKDEKEAKSILEQAEQYIKDIDAKKRSFLENYMPDELEKLDCAKAKQFGNYVIVAIADRDDAKDIFDRADSLLKK